jgi:mono/diheme cytochrome c family protein/plastocyanin
MSKMERIFRCLVVTALILTTGVTIFFWSKESLIHARIPEKGGWSPNIIKAQVGKSLRLKFTSDDVVHGFAVGQLPMPEVEILPGKISEITLTFDKPGTYTFYCTRWCGVNHWRMRGIIDVEGERTGVQTVSPPLYVSINLDLDEEFEALSVPDEIPSPIRGKELIQQIDLDDQLLSSDYYRKQSPYQVFETLNSTNLSEDERWDIVAYLWQINTTLTGLETGRELYARNCAACHGENGAGDGVFADDLLKAGQQAAQTMNGEREMAMQIPSDFTDPRHLLAKSPAYLQGKILRGGMGTGMPMWGSIFTEQQLWDLVAYLYTFYFNYPNKEVQ